MDGRMKTVEHSARPAIMPKIRVKSSMRMAAVAQTHK